ncbi:helix-turn-helix domain-containing protein [Flavobacterium sp. WW92]|uniref:helix-turn-helix domain-containing protein n=1 Tax=unclassified Flavobacterium TaxID=196869 RepID=UPI0022252224|nr:MULTISPECIES: helix-turn-helix domain-containing protein [unclassified Flavobacterium]WDO13089.1 helix-turn-helix domain-containing protein [Flavobacterium sp. WW92]
MQSITISVTDLNKAIRNAVAAEFENFKQNFSKFKDEDLIPRKKAATLLACDLSTLKRWTDEGYLKSHKIGGRVYYKKSENPKHFN